MAQVHSAQGSGVASYWREAVAQRGRLIRQALPRALRARIKRLSIPAREWKHFHAGVGLSRRLTLKE